MSLPLVSSADALDADWLTAALREAGALPAGRVAAARGVAVGTGKMGDNVRYELEYEGAPDDVPASLIAKLPSTDPTARAHASAAGNYWREVHFYRELASRVRIRTPRAYISMIHDNRTDYVILMEDLAPAEPGDQIEGCDPDRAALALREAAKLHASVWNAPFLGELEWITQSTPEGAELGRAFLGSMWPGFLDRFGAAMSTEAVALGERFVREFVAWASDYDGPRTIVHADYRLENMLFGDGETAPPIAVVDWQSPFHTCPLVDVAYFVGGGLTVDDRRAHERELVELYRSELAANGVDLDADACWDLYRRYALHGILITVLGAMMSGVEERGDRMFTAMIQRHAQHALDLESDSFLP